MTTSFHSIFYFFSLLLRYYGFKDEKVFLVDYRYWFCFSLPTEYLRCWCKIGQQMFGKRNKKIRVLLLLTLAYFLYIYLRKHKRNLFLLLKIVKFIVLITSTSIEKKESFRWTAQNQVFCFLIELGIDYRSKSVKIRLIGQCIKANGGKWNWNTNINMHTCYWSIFTYLWFEREKTAIFSHFSFLFMVVANGQFD